MAEVIEADEQQGQLRTVASELISWKGGLRVLRQAQLPKWRGYFKWQIEEKIEMLQAAYARLRAEAAKPGAQVEPGALPSSIVLVNGELVKLG